MSSRSARNRDVAARLEPLRRRLEQWRRTRQGRSRIPESLWQAAVKAAGRYGLNPTAQALGLDYYSLKKRVESADSRRVAERKSASHSMPGLQAIPADDQAMAAFVELAAAPPAGTPECILELEDSDGAKMRVHLKGAEAPDLTALTRSFWGNADEHRSRPSSRKPPGRRRT